MFSNLNLSKTHFSRKKNDSVSVKTKPVLFTHIFHMYRCMKHFSPSHTSNKWRIFFTCLSQTFLHFSLQLRRTFLWGHYPTCPPSNTSTCLSTRVVPTRSRVTSFTIGRTTFETYIPHVHLQILPCVCSHGVILARSGVTSFTIGRTTFEASGDNLWGIRKHPVRTICAETRISLIASNIIWYTRERIVIASNIIWYTRELTSDWLWYLWWLWYTRTDTRLTLIYEKLTPDWLWYTRTDTKLTLIYHNWHKTPDTRLTEKSYQQFYIFCEIINNFTFLGIHLQLTWYQQF